MHLRYIRHINYRVFVGMHRALRAAYSSDSFASSSPSSRDELSSGPETMGQINDGSSTRVLFCGPHFPASHNYTREYVLKYHFIQVDDVPFASVPEVISSYDVCVVMNMRMDSSIIHRAKRMKVIMQFGVGLEGVDIDAATKCGIKVARIPGDLTGNAASCAEMAIYLILGLLKKQKCMEAAVKARMLGEPIGDTLFGKTVFIMGFGNIGIDLAKRLKPFGVKILATKRNWASQMDAFNDIVDEKGNHHEIFKFAAKSDIIVCCLILDKETVGIVDESFLSSMKKGAFLVNVARGNLFDYDAILRSLGSGHLGGLGIDVSWNEPFDPNDPILSFNNVILTPHVAGVTEHSYRRMAKVVGDVALQLHSGQTLRGIEMVN